MKLPWKSEEGGVGQPQRVLNVFVLVLGPKFELMQEVIEVLDFIWGACTALLHSPQAGLAPDDEMVGNHPTFQYPLILKQANSLNTWGSEVAWFPTSCPPGAFRPSKP